MAYTETFETDVADSDRIIELDQQWRAVMSELAELRAEQKRASHGRQGMPSQEEREQFAQLAARGRSLADRETALRAERDALKADNGDGNLWGYGIEQQARGIARALTEIRQQESVQVTHEPLTYEREAQRSYFRDLILSEARDDHQAKARLAQHEMEMRVELPKREQRARERAQREGLELRVNPSRTTGQGGYFAPPLWLVDEFAGVPRPGRVLADLARGLPLPQGVQSVQLPRLTTGNATATNQDRGPAASTDVVDTQVTSPVVTITGEGDVSLQLLEQSPPGAHLDWAFFKDLNEDYDQRLETQLINGSGGAGQLTGLLNVSNINTVTFTSGSPTGSLEYTPIGKMVAQIGDNRLRPPEAWLMRTARWAWIGTAEDTAGLPISTPGHIPAEPLDGNFNDRRPTPVVPILGFPNYLDDVIPVNLGAGTNQDVIILCRPSDMLVLESEPRTRVMLDVLSGTLQARLQLRGYSAALLGRYPTGISVLSGTGMVVQSGY